MQGEFEIYNASSFVQLEKTLELLNELSDIGKIKNVIFKTHSEKSLRDFINLEEKKRVQIYLHLNDYLNSLRSVETFKNQDDELTREDELECLEHALNTFKLKSLGEDTNFIEENDIIEIYNNQGIQIWRNFELLKLSPYDLLTLLMYEWYVLYERSKIINQKIMDRIQYLISLNNSSATPMQIEKHTMKAKSAEEELVVSINLKYFKPLFSKINGERMGFLVTTKSSPFVLRGEDSEKVKFF